MPVKQGGQLEDGRILLGHLSTVDQKTVGEHLDLVGAAFGQPCRCLFEPGQRDGDCWMAARIERHRASCSLADAGELGETIGGVWPQLGSGGSLGHV